jgi:hypothetical protein
LVRLRHDALIELEGNPGLETWPPELPDPMPNSEGVVEIRADELTASRIGGAIQHHGCLLVRGLIPDQAVARLVQDIDRAFEAAEAWRQGNDSWLGQDADDAGLWFEPFTPDPRYELEMLGVARRNRDYFRVLVADSPSAMFDVFEAFERAGLRDHLSGYLGSRPVLSKLSMRRMPLRPENLGWHQERSVFRRATRSINFWIALSPCGKDAPGLEVIPSRVNHEVVESSSTTNPSEDQARQTPARKSYALRDGDVEALGLTEPVAPVFEPGDALVFDDLLLHRTAAREGMKDPRYSIESWFFAAQEFPRWLLPIVF